MAGWDFSRLGLQPAENVAYCNAYLLSQEGARALLTLCEEHDSEDHEGILVRLQERGRCYTTLPKLALQTWTAVSDIQTDARVHGIRRWYETQYFKKFDRALYDEPKYTL